MNVFIDTLNNNKEQLEELTKLTLTDIHIQTELCVGKCYFLHKNNVSLFQNRGPIGLSVMVVLSKNYLHKVECRAIMEAFNYKIAPLTFRRFVDDSQAQERSYADKYLEILDKQDPTIKSTVEFEDRKHSLNFVDISIISNTTNKKITNSKSMERTQ